MQYRIKNWEQFQHFKDRLPPWIKVYRSLLDDPDWHALDGEDAKVLVMLWLVASEDKLKVGTLPASNKLAFRLRMNESTLIQTISRLYHWVEQVDINLISPRYRDDAPETETETETETDIMSGKPSALPDASSLSSQKNGQHYNPQAREVLEFLNAKTGRHYQPVDANLKLIVARLKEGASVADCRAVVAKKCREWSTDEKMSDYLRPATLFNATKFAQYRGELTEVQND